MTDLWGKYRFSLIDPDGAVVGRSDEADTDRWIPVRRPGTIVAVRVGDITVDPDGVATMRLPEVRLTAQTFAGAGAMTVAVTVEAPR